MDANRRFEIRQRCPSLRELEKSVPLKINSLVLTEGCVTVNDTAYRIGSIRKSKTGETPIHVAELNNIGGVSYDVDEYGVQDESEELPVTPGDLVLSQHERPFMQQEGLLIQSLEFSIQFCEEDLANLRERRPSRRNLEKIHKIEKVIEEFRAMKQMVTLLFGGRSSPVHVTKLGIDFLIPGVIRLSIGLKLHIEQLVFRAGSGTTVEVLAPILQESSFPLKKLEIGGWSDEDVTNPMVQTAESLRIRGYLTNIPQALSSITNPVVCISMQMLPEQAIEKLVGNWIESQRPVGYKYIFDFYCEPSIPAEMEDMLKELNGVIIDDETVIIPMSECTQLKVSYGPFQEFAPRSKWAVKFLTEAIVN
ncbi:unnamed protein product [Caenorhabditis brenneri]